MGSRRPTGSGKLKVDDRTVPAIVVAWELAHGAVPAGRDVEPCPLSPSCVRIEHLSLTKCGQSRRRVNGARAIPGAGSRREIRPGVWKLTITLGTNPNGTQRRVSRTVHVDTAAAAARELALFVAEVVWAPPPVERPTRELTMDEAVERFLTQHLAEEKARETKTVDDYRKLHKRRFAPHIGSQRVRDVELSDLDGIFGRMRRAGLSRSRMNQAKSLYGPFFRWAKRRGMTTHNPMTEFELPTSAYVARERTPPEVDELSLLLTEAVTVIPEVAPLLVLGAVTGMRRGELVGLRRSRVKWKDSRLVVDAAIDEGKRVKTTKTRRERTVHIDAGTMAMLRRHCDEMDERVEALGVPMADDPFVFSLAEDCSKPMPPDFVTKRVGILKEHLGIANKRPEVIALEDEALRLFRLPPSERTTAAHGPAPKGGLSLSEIGARLGRTQRWAMFAIASAERRERARQRGLDLDFDGSILALRKFTSSELLDAGFNISMVAQRQGHGPGVLVKHYSKARRSADRSAADHLGRVVHGSAASESHAGGRRHAGEGGLEPCPRLQRQTAHGECQSGAALATSSNAPVARTLTPRRRFCTGSSSPVRRQ